MTEERKPRYDRDEVKAAARNRWPEVLAAAGIPRESLDGRHHACPKCRGADRFELFDVDAGAVHCFGVCGTKCGDGLAAVQWIRNCDFIEALAFTAEVLGVQPVEGQAKPQTPEEILAAVALAKKVKPESLQHYGGTVKNGAVNFPTWDAKGKPALPFRIWLGGGKRGKGMFDKRQEGGPGAGLFLPVVDGQPVLPQPGDTILVFEGVKDPAAAHEMGYQAVGLNTCRLNRKFARLFRDVHVILCPDRDTAGDDGAQSSASVLFRKAASVRIAVWPVEIKATDGADFRDVRAMADGEALIREAIDTAQEWQPASDPDYRPGKPEIKIGPDELRMTDQAIEALATRPDLYQRGGMLCEVREAPKPPPCIVRPDGGIRAVRAPRPRLREMIANTCQFVKLKKTPDGEEWVPTHVPQTLVDQVEVRGEWPGLQQLEGVVGSPQFLADGSVLVTPGYDRRSGLYFYSDVTFAGIQERPSRDDAIAAAGRLLEVVTDFPIRDVDKSSWLAFVLTVCARYAIDGPCPLGAADANVRGSGKTKMMDCVGLIHTGRRLPVSAITADNDENRKSITATLLAGEPLTLWDNVATVLGGPAIDALLTSTTWTDRILGVSQMTAALPTRTVFLATGNNLEFAADTARRSLRVRLESPLENPEERTGFKHPNLLQYVKENRGQLAVDAVTILRAWHCDGRKDQGLQAWGSFEAWSDLIRNPIVWLGLPDPGETRQEVQRDSDREAMLLRQLINAWELADPEQAGMTVVDAIDRATERPGKPGDPALAAVFAELAGPGGKPSPRSIGMKIAHLKGRVCAGRYFSKRDSHGTAVWVVRSAEKVAAELGEGGTNGTSWTNNLPTRANADFHSNTENKNTHVLGQPAGNSPTTATSPTCNHIDPSSWVARDGALHCPGCAKWMGRVRATA